MAMAHRLQVIWGYCSRSIGTQNRLVNEAYKTAFHEKHNWVQCIQALLNTHGFGDVWLNPFIASSSFHKLLKTRLDDQFKQERRSKLLSSSRFDTFKYFIEDDRQESYIYKIRNPCIRKIFTRLRIDMIVLSTCRINKTIAPACPLCSREPESVLHFVLKCPVYDRQRNLFIDKIVSRSPSFPNLDDIQKLKYIVDLKCPPEVINQCCKFIAEIYALTERQSTANSWWSNITYVLEIIYLLVSIIWVFFVLVFWSSYLTLSSTNVVHLDIRVIFLHVCYDLYVLLVKLTSVLVMPIKILNLESWVDQSHRYGRPRRLVANQRDVMTRLLELLYVLNIKRNIL